MSLRLTRKGFITSVTDDPSMRGLNAYLAGRRQFRDDGGHGGGGTGDAGGDDTPPDGSDTGEGESDDEDDDAEEDDTKDTKNKKDTKDDDEEVVPKWKYDKLHKRMQAADTNASTLRKQLDELKANADVPAEVKKELEEVKGKVASVEAERDKHVEANRVLTIKLASLTMKGLPKWANADTALKLADLSDVDISDDGKVDSRALKAALNALAKEHPYLVAKEDKGDTGNESGAGSASKMNGKRTGQRDAPNKETLAKRFPALSRGGA
jgi:copper chaperone CopZ